MGTFSRLTSVPHKGTRVERRVLVCEICGERLEVDRESGERHCPVCEMPDQEE